MTPDAFDAIDSLHPDCPDWQRMGPTTLDAGIRAMAETQAVRDAGRKEVWSKGFTRRRLLAGGMGAGVAAIGSQLVTTRVAYGAGAATGTLVVVFLRGGMDGLSMLAPTGTAAAVAELVSKRGDIALRGDSPGAMGLDRGFVLSPALDRPQAVRRWQARCRTGRLDAVAEPQPLPGAGLPRARWRVRRRVVRRLARPPAPGAGHGDDVPVHRRRLLGSTVAARPGRRRS